MMQKTIAQSFSRKLIVIVALAAAVGFVIYLFSNRKPNNLVEYQQNPIKSPKEAPVFFWCSGILSKRDGKWYLNSDKLSGNGQLIEIIAYPWYSFAHPVSVEKSVSGTRAFPRYTGEKYDADGHPYPVGSASRWFGGMCLNAKDFEHYITLMLTIKQQFGEDPPGQKPTFEGAGFYIVTGA